MSSLGGLHLPTLLVCGAAVCTTAAVWWTLNRRAAYTPTTCEQLPPDERHLTQEPAARASSPRSVPAAKQPNQPKSRCTDDTPSKPPPRSEAVLQGNEARLALYRHLEDEFALQGVDKEAVESVSGSFGGLEQTDWPGVWPKDYPMAFPSVRLVVVPLDGGQFAADARLAQASAAVTREVMSVLVRAGCTVYTNPRASYHASMFYLSHPSDLRPDTAVVGGGLLVRHGVVVAPTEDALEAERRGLTDVAARMPRLRLQVERVLFNRGGCLLVVFTDASKRHSKRGGAWPVDALRGGLRDAFPGAPAKQPGPMIHSTLLRLLAPSAPLPEPTVAAVAEVCMRWTTKLRGLTYDADRLWLVHEKGFSSLEGAKETVMLAKA